MKKLFLLLIINFTFQEVCYSKIWDKPLRVFGAVATGGLSEAALAVLKKKAKKKAEREIQAARESAARELNKIKRDARIEMVKAKINAQREMKVSLIESNQKLTSEIAKARARIGFLEASTLLVPKMLIRSEGGFYPVSEIVDHLKSYDSERTHYDEFSVELAAIMASSSFDLKLVEILSVLRETYPEEISDIVSALVSSLVGHTDFVAPFLLSMVKIEDITLKSYSSLIKRNTMAQKSSDKKIRSLEQELSGLK